MLHNYLKDSKEKDKRKTQWTLEELSQFRKCMKYLSNAALLSYLNSEITLALFTDTSRSTIASILQNYDKMDGNQ